ncbi:unnamed protein product [Chrysoparadoxa australica]
MRVVALVLALSSHMAAAAAFAALRPGYLESSLFARPAALRAPASRRQQRQRGLVMEDDFLRSMGLLDEVSKGYTDITVSDAVQMMMVPGQAYVYLDVRSAEEHEELVAPPQSINLPAFEVLEGKDWEDAQYDEKYWSAVDGWVEAVERSWGKERPVLVGVKASWRSVRAAELLAAAGFKEVYNVESATFLRTRPEGEDF